MTGRPRTICSLPPERRRKVEALLMGGMPPNRVANQLSLPRKSIVNHWFSHCVSLRAALAAHQGQVAEDDKAALLEFRGA